MPIADKRNEILNEVELTLNYSLSLAVGIKKSMNYVLKTAHSQVTPAALSTFYEKSADLYLACLEHEGKVTPKPSSFFPAYGASRNPYHKDVLRHEFQTVLNQLLGLTPAIEVDTPLEKRP